MLRRLKKYRFPLYLGALLFALSGVLHPLFHMLDDDGCRRAVCAAVGKTASPHSSGGHNAPAHPDSHCPICAGLFSSAEVPEPPPLPAAPERPTIYLCALPTPHQPEFAVRQQVRAPPVLS